MRRIFGFILLLTGVALWGARLAAEPAAPAAMEAAGPVAAVGTATGSGEAVPVIRIHGEIHKFALRAVQAQVRQALALKPSNMIFDVDSNSGQLEYALGIVNVIADLPRAVSTSAFVSGHATGYSLLIALSCDRMIATEGSVLGDCPPVSYNARAQARENDGYQRFVSYRLDAACKKRGYNLPLTEAMVDKRAVVHHDASGFHVSGLSGLLSQEAPTGRLIDDAEGRLELTGADIVAAGYSRGLVRDLREAATTLGLDPQRLTPLHYPPLGRDGAEQRVAIINIVEEIDYGLQKYVERSIEQAKAKKATVIIFNMDTPGGTVTSGLEIQKMILTLADEGIVTICYVNREAISAGALTGLACNQVVMRTASAMGDCEPIFMAGAAIETAPEKIQTYLRERFRTNAQKNDYPQLLCEAMVTKEMGVHRILTPNGFDYLTDGDAKGYRGEVFDDETLVESGKLPTFNDEEAYRLGFATFVVKDNDELYARYGIAKENVFAMEISWSEEMVRFLNSPLVTSILLIVGIVSLLTEFKMPGTIVPGVVGLLCFAVIFTSKYMVNLANAIDIVLFVVGGVLVILEVFIIPGFGIPGIIGGLMMVVALILSFQSFVIPTQPWEWTQLYSTVMTLSVSVIIAIAIFLIVTRWLPKTPLLRRLVLATAQTAGEGYTTAVPEEKLLEGTAGVAITTLRPTGKAEFNGKPYTVMADGDFIEAGMKIKVVEAKGNRIMVTRV